MTKIVAVFTYRSIETILAEQGSQAWKCNPERVRECQYVVLTRNQHGVPPMDGHPGIAAEGDEPHRSAFMIGRISDVANCDGFDPQKPRYLFMIDKWAPLDIPDFWEKWRGPVKYLSLEDTTIDLAALKWQDVPPRGATKPKPEAVIVPAARTIEQIADELKRAIAAQRRVSAENVAINVSIKVEEAFAI